MKRYVLLYQDEDGAWIAEVPGLRGCGSDGATPEEALENVKEAIDANVEALREGGRPVPDENINLRLAEVEIEMAVERE